MTIETRRASHADRMLDLLTRHRLYLFGCAAILLVVLLQYVPAIDLVVSALFFDPELGEYALHYFYNYPEMLAVVE